MAFKMVYVCVFDKFWHITVTQVDYCITTTALKSHKQNSADTVRYAATQQDIHPAYSCNL